MSRCAVMRPAMRKLAPSANFSRACAISPEGSNAAPKGATPSFSKAANFSRRSASNSLSVGSMPGSDSKQNRADEQIEWVARASRVLVSASRRNNLFDIHVQSLIFSQEKWSWSHKETPRDGILTGRTCFRMSWTRRSASLHSFCLSLLRRQIANVSIVPEGLASSQTDIYRDKFG